MSSKESSGDAHLRRRRPPEPHSPDSSEVSDGGWASKGDTDGKGKAKGNGLKLELPDGAKNIAATLQVKGDRVKVLAPGTPWNEIDLGDTFLSHLPSEKKKKKSIFNTRRLFFILGSLAGLFLGWLFTEGNGGLSINERLLADFDFDSTLQALRDSLAETSLFSSIAGLNISDIFQAAGKSWITNTDFVVGRQLKAEGAQKKHAVMMIPGIVSTGLESWSTAEEHSGFFRKRIWGTSYMIRAVATRKEAWIKAMSLDPVTGLDPPGSKVRAAQGLDAAAYFVQGYWIWQKIIENLAVLDFDHNDMSLAAYDWRLAFLNLEIRDNYFSRLRVNIEHTKRIMGKKTVLVSHSMGGSVVLFFFKWVEAKDYGNGGPNWVSDHIESWINIAGTTLGVPKATAALLSGEMRDTVELNPAGVYLLERFFSRSERTALFRTWAGSASMWPKGGNEVWGSSEKAPDDPDDSDISLGNAYYFRSIGAGDDINARTTRPNLTMDEAYGFLLQHSSSAFQQMLATNYSNGFERDPEAIRRNDNDPRKWSNPLEVRLPNAPDMKIFCLYGVGKPTERSFFYKSGPFSYEDVNAIAENATCDLDHCKNQTTRAPLQFPTSEQVWVDNDVTLEAAKPKVKSGVLSSDGDGTVSVLSLGAMCTHGWKSKLYNPSGMRVVTHELAHRPQGLDLRGGPTTADHIDILGSSELNEAVLNVVAGRSERVDQKIISEVEKFASRIKWPE